MRTKEIREALVKARNYHDCHDSRAFEKLHEAVWLLMVECEKEAQGVQTIADAVTILAKLAKH